MAGPSLSAGPRRVDADKMPSTVGMSGPRVARILEQSPPRTPKNPPSRLVKGPKSRRCAPPYGFRQTDRAPPSAASQSATQMLAPAGPTSPTPIARKPRHARRCNPRGHDSIKPNHNRQRKNRLVTALTNPDVRAALTDCGESPGDAFDYRSDCMSSGDGLHAGRMFRCRTARG